MKIIVLLIVAVVSASGDEKTPADTSCGLSNGRLWGTMSYLSKLTYVRGLMDGLGRAGKLGAYFPGGSLTLGDLTAAVEGLYGDTANVLVPIVDAVKAVKFRFEGIPQNQVEYGLALDRRMAMRCSENQLH